MEFFNNKSNEILKFKLNAEGINTNNVEARLVFNTKNKTNCIIFGQIKENICTFEVPELKFYDNGQSGNIKFELVSEDLYFNVWEDKFEIKTKTTVTLEKLVHETIEQEKPKIKVTLDEKIIENKTIKEEPSDIKENITNIEQIVEEKIESKESLLNFNDFFNKMKNKNKDDNN